MFRESTVIKKNDLARIIVLLIEVADIQKVFSMAFEAQGNSFHLHMSWGHFIFYPSSKINKFYLMQVLLFS